MSENELRGRIEELEKKVETFERALDEIDDAMLNIVIKLRTKEKDVTQNWV